MPTIGSLRDTEFAIDQWNAVQWNFEEIERDVFHRTPTRVDGVPVTTSGPPTTGTYVLNQVYRDVDLVEWLCTVAGEPGTWVRLYANENLGNTDLTSTGDRTFNSDGNDLTFIGNNDFDVLANNQIDIVAGNSIVTSAPSLIINGGLSPAGLLSINPNSVDNAFAFTETAIAAEGTDAVLFRVMDGVGEIGQVRFDPAITYDSLAGAIAGGGGGSGNLDGGAPDSVYGGTDPVDGGVP